jgi:glutamine amidotransferase
MRGAQTPVQQTIAIVDCGSGNSERVQRAYEDLGARAFVVGDDIKRLAQADRIILTDAGAFPDAMRHLRTRGLDEALSYEVLEGGVPFFGIGLGMQLMAAVSDELTETKGLGWVDARVVPLRPTESDQPNPHTGWNEVWPVCASPLFDGIRPGEAFHFLHSFHVACAEDYEVLATTPHRGRFVSAIQRGHMFGVQFHPETSGPTGLRLLENFLSV